jgi:predicted glycoside hydrolase/deacetylase ChbG (UPF0249 family)
MVGRVILTADDYAIAPGVSAAIRELAQQRRLSATSAMSNMATWPEEAARLKPLRDRIAIGLHLDLTAWRPLGAMPSLAPERRFPKLPSVLAAGLRGRLNGDEIAAEIERQLDAFERALGFPPDHVDGHQHVHAVPGVFEPLLDLLSQRYGRRPPLVRVPRARLATLPGLGSTGVKAAVVSVLAGRLRRAARARGLPVNDAFAGFSGFQEGTSYAAELDAAISDVLAQGARLGIVMCHPGVPDGDLAEKDGVLARRQEELDALLTSDKLAGRIWHIEREATAPGPIDWSREAQR